MPILPSTVDALPAFVEPKYIEVFVKNGVFSETEIRSRYEILLEHYSKTLNIEALTMLDMAKKQILPAVVEYTKMVCETLGAKKALGIELDLTVETELAKKLSALEADMFREIAKLEADVMKVKDVEDVLENARFYHDPILTDMEALRVTADELEMLVGEDYWPLPSYTELLF